MRVFIISALLVAAIAALSHPDGFHQRARGGRVYREAVSALQGSGQYYNETVNTLDQLIDHTNPAKGTFVQRWWQDRSAYVGGQYAMLYINGEGPVHRSPVGFMADYAHNISAAIFTMEHRYYGESLPAPLTDKATLQTLTVENALADLMYFVTYIEQNVLGKNMTWVVCGGSYSGALTAWMKETYPNKFAAAWSSSGVVNTRFDYYAFDGHIVSVLPPVCYKAIKQVFDTFSSMYDNPTTRQQVYDAFGTPSYFTKTDMAWMLADGSAMAVQYGSKDYLCDTIVPLNPDPLAALSQYSNLIESLWGPDFAAGCYYSTACLSNSSFASQWGPAGYSWVYQCCSQVAYWQTGYPGSLRLREITTDYYVDQCRQAFNPTIFADTYAFNAAFGGATPNAVNVIALQGSDDPWQTAGVQSSLGPLYPEVTAQCNGCGHCGDLMTPLTTDPASLVAQRTTIVSYMNKWLGIN